MKKVNKLQGHLKAIKVKYRKQNHLITIEIIGQIHKKSVLVKLTLQKLLSCKNRDKNSIWKVGKRKS